MISAPFNYVAADGGEPALVTVVTDVDAASSGFAETAQSLVQQSLQAWEWLVLVPHGVEPPRSDITDERIRIVETPTRARGMREALEAAAEYAAVLECGELLQPTTLEKWLWFLDARRDCAVVSGSRERSGRPQMFRKSVAVALGGLDAAVGAPFADAEAGVVPHSGAVGETAAAVYEGLLPPYFQTPNEWLPEHAPLRNTLQKNGPRVLFVIPWMTLGGADKFNLDLFAQLRRAGWEVSVATTLVHDHALLPEYARTTPDLFPLSEFLRLVDYPRFLRYLVESRQPDVVVVSNSELGYRLLPYLRAHCPTTALVDFCHSEAEHWNFGGHPRLSLEYRELLDLTITASAHLRAWMEQRGGDPDRLEVSYANVDTDAVRLDPDRRARTRRRLGLDPADVVVIFVGRVSEDKQPHVLAQTFRQLRDGGCSYKALVVGDGPDLPGLRRFIEKHRLDDVQLLGERPHEEVVELLEAADVAFLPSRSEGIALTLYESMAAGTPVVAAAVGGQAELVTPECGVLVRPDGEAEQAARFTQALRGLIEDDSRRRAMGEAARNRVVSHFRIEDMGRRMIELLESAVALRDTAPRPAPTRALGRALATQSVELTRLAQVSDWLWQQGTSRGNGRPTLAALTRQAAAKTRRLVTVRPR